MRNVLLTGGLGYIGSHTVLSLIEQGHAPIIIDNLSNSNLHTLKALHDLSKVDIPFYQIDILNTQAVEEVFQGHDIQTVIHFAALKSVPDSIKQPLNYYQNNIDGLRSLLTVVKKHQIQSFIFSSSAAIYDAANAFPLSEEATLGYTNPYAFTKLCGEWMLNDFFLNHPNVQIAKLRYFNPLGNHPSGLIGDPGSTKATNIMPMIYKCLANQQPFEIYGNDYKTEDGSALRDYIHVQDLADAHTLMLNYLENSPGIHTFNVGLGHAISVKQLIKTFQQVNSVELDVKLSPPREGDLPVCFANAIKIMTHTRWNPKHDLSQMCRDAFTYYMNSL